MSGPLPLVVVEGAAAAAVATLRAELERAGWRVVDASWAGEPEPAVRSGAGVVRLGVVTDAAAASHAVLAALAGDGLLLVATADREVVDRLCEDLRRFGAVRHVVAGAEPPPGLADEQRALLRLLLAGETLGAAAVRLHLSRRTADRRMAEVRRHYGVTSTAAALAAARARADL
jgi:DNA-binding NarL/FixJ family response regulator